MALMLPRTPRTTQAMTPRSCAAGWTWGPCCRPRLYQRTPLSCWSAAPPCSGRSVPEAAAEQVGDCPARLVEVVNE